MDRIPTRSVALTLVDFAELVPRLEVRATFQRGREIGLLDIEAAQRGRAPAEWRPFR